jgi:signal transduction histidine kinase
LTNAQEKTKETKKGPFLLKHPVLMIILVYDLSVLLGAACYYFLIPLMLNYPPEFIGITEKLGAPLYFFQFAIIVFLVFLASDTFLFLNLKDINQIHLQQQFEPADSGKHEAFLKVWEKYLNLPYQIYFFGIVFGAFTTILFLIIIGFKIGIPYSFILKISVLIFSFFAFVGIVSLFFSKGIFSRILLSVYREGYEKLEKKRFSLRYKTFIQILPLFIVAVLFTALLGYSRLLEEKGNLLFRIYKTQLGMLFQNTRGMENAGSIERIIQNISFESKKDSYFIINPEGKIIDSKGRVLTKIFLIYLKEFAGKYNGHVYGDDAELQGAVISIPGKDGKPWVVGIRYEVVSPVTMLYFLFGFLALMGLSIFTLFFFSKALAKDIDHVAENLEAIAAGQEENLAHQIPVTSNDEVGRLVAAFNSIQRRVREYVESIREHEKTIQEQADLMLAQGRHAIMGEMLSNIAHQWRQPLNIVGLMVQNIQQHQKAKILTETYVNDNVRSAMDVLLFMSKTIDDFRNFFRPDKEKKDFSIKEAVEQTLGIVGASLSENFINLQITVEEDVRLSGYPNEYKQVLLNLMSNAKDALLGRKVQSPFIKIRIFKNKSHSVLTVTDNGGGIDKKILHKIFDPYFTSKESGTGIGLYMSKVIVEKNMEGKLSVKNVDRGAEFKVEI